MNYRKYFPINLPLDEVGDDPISRGAIEVAWAMEIHRRYENAFSTDGQILKGSEVATALNDDFLATRINEDFLPHVLNTKLPRMIPEALAEVLAAGKSFAHYGPFEVAAFAPYLVSQLACLEWDPCVDDEAAKTHVLLLQYHHMTWELIFTRHRKKPIVLGLRFSLPELISESNATPSPYFD